MPRLRSFHHRADGGCSMRSKLIWRVDAHTASGIAGLRRSRSRRAARLRSLRLAKFRRGCARSAAGLPLCNLGFDHGFQHCGEGDGVGESARDCDVALDELSLVVGELDDLDVAVIGADSVNVVFGVNLRVSPSANHHFVAGCGDCFADVGCHRSGEAGSGDLVRVMCRFHVSSLVPVYTAVNTEGATKCRGPK